MIQIALPRTRRKARIEIIPLIDIVFFLLATFVLVSLSMVKNQGLPIRLPAASVSRALDRDALMLRITKDGQLSVDRQTVALEALQGPLAAYQRDHADPKVILQGDTDVAYGKVVAVLDKLRALGVTKIAVQTTRQAAA